MITFYLPIILEGRDKYEFDCKTFGLFRTEKEAIVCLLKQLCSEQYVYDYENECEIPEQTLNKWIDSIDLFEDLISLCKEEGDSYYDEGWRIRIDKFDVSIDESMTS